MQIADTVIKKPQNTWLSLGLQKTESEAGFQTDDWEEVTRLEDFCADWKYISADGKPCRMTAKYADTATAVFPVVQVTITDEQGSRCEHFVDITKIDTGHATEIEMFALCSHVDTKRNRYQDIPDSTLSSWESLLFYREMDAQNKCTDQNGWNTVSGTKRYNWRRMIHDAAGTYMENELYERYLHVNRMQDMLEFYSRFEERPVAFVDTFHAIRDYESIRVLSLEDDINIEIYHKKREIVCKELGLERGGKVLWRRKLTEEELLRAAEIAASPYQAYMKNYSFWDDILSGKCQIEDYGTYWKELKKQYRNDAMFSKCPSQVKQAWKYAEKKATFYSMEFLDEGMESGFISEYMRMLIESRKQGMGAEVMGTTVRSAIHMANENLKKLEEMDFGQLSETDKKWKLKETAFYHYFLEYLDPAQKYDPIQALLQNREEKVYK